VWTIEALELYDNRLIDNLPSGISNLTALKLLDVEACNFTGELFTESVLSLTEMVALRCSFNAFTGKIPSEISSLANLKQFWIAENKMSGTLPAELAQLSSLGKYMNNVFSETVLLSPHTACVFSSKETLFIYENSFQGTIISGFGSLTNLTELRFYRNELTGPIPEDMYSATGLQILRLDENSLTGEVSTLIGKLVTLEDLRLNDQSKGFSGAIPAEIGSLALISKWKWHTTTRTTLHELTQLYVTLTQQGTYFSITMISRANFQTSLMTSHGLSSSICQITDLRELFLPAFLPSILFETYTFPTTYSLAQFLRTTRHPLL
jgi:Leucine-rich repeat (LRR) protein